MVVVGVVVVVGIAVVVIILVVADSMVVVVVAGMGGVVVGAAAVVVAGVVLATVKVREVMLMAEISSEMSEPAATRLSRPCRKASISCWGWDRREATRSCWPGSSVIHRPKSTTKLPCLSTQTASVSRCPSVNMWSAE